MSTCSSRALVQMPTQPAGSCLSMHMHGRIRCPWPMAWANMDVQQHMPTTCMACTIVVVSTAQCQQSRATSLVPAPCTGEPSPTAGAAGRASTTYKPALLHLILGTNTVRSLSIAMTAKGCKRAAWLDTGNGSDAAGYHVGWRHAAT